MQDETLYVKNLLKEFGDLPRFPDGRIDFSGADRAPVVTCFVEFEGKLLLLRRSDRVRTYKGKWCTVAGYLDEPKPVARKALIELEEELEITEPSVRDYRVGTPYEFEDPDACKTWIVHPVIVWLAERPRIVLDREHTEFKWIAPNAIVEHETVPMLEKSFRAAIGS